LVRRHAEIMEGRKHWYLNLVATRPEYQGKGAAGKLLRWGIQRADEDGTETYLEASPDGKPIYEHLGFKEVDRLVADLKEEVLGEKQSHLSDQLGCSEAVHEFRSIKNI
jgi:GNAT superfamily N-acetyltransferase